LKSELGSLILHPADMSTFQEVVDVQMGKINTSLSQLQKFTLEHKRQWKIFDNLSDDTTMRAWRITFVDSERQVGVAEIVTGNMQSIENAWSKIARGRKAISVIELDETQQ
jgi:hypothetical protein